LLTLLSWKLQLFFQQCQRWNTFEGGLKEITNRAYFEHGERIYWPEALRQLLADALALLFTKLPDDRLRRRRIATSGDIRSNYIAIIILESKARASTNE